MTTASTTSFAYDSRQLAETYDRLSDTQFESGKELVRHLGDLEGARVLDVGCGTGRLARWLAGVVGPSGSVVGIDPLAERIAIARTQVGGIRFEVGQAEDLGAFEDESFDAVCMSSVFHWVTDKPRALAEIRRVLDVGGQLGLTTMSKELSGAVTWSAVMNPLLERVPYARRAGDSPTIDVRLGQTTTDLLSTVLESKLRLEELRITPRTWSRTSGKELVDFLDSSSFGNLLRIVPDELGGTLRSELIEAFDALKGPDGAIVVRDWVTLLIAKRV